MRPESFPDACLPFSLDPRSIYLPKPRSLTLPPSILKGTDYFPGLGWMIHKSTWLGVLKEEPIARGQENQEANMGGFLRLGFCAWISMCTALPNRTKDADSCFLWFMWVLMMVMMSMMQRR